MQKPYFLDPKMPSHVRKYMDEQSNVDVDIITSLIKINHKPRAKEKTLRITVKAAIEWNKYLIEQERLKKLEEATIEDTNGVVLTAEDVEIVEQPKLLATLDENSLEQQKGQKYTFKYTTFQDDISPSEYICDPTVEDGLCFVLSRYWLKSEPSVNVLISGSAECGKSTLTSVMKQMIKVEKFDIKLEKLLKGGVVNPLKKLKEQFTKIHAQSPGIIHIHNLEILSNNDKFIAKSYEKESFVTVLQNYIQQISKENDFKNLLIIGETSKPELLDFRLAKCFSFTINIPHPSTTERENLIRYFCQSQSVGENVDIKRVALMASGYVAGDLKYLVTESATSAQYREYCSIDRKTIPRDQLAEYLCNTKIEKSGHIQDEDFLRALTKITSSLNKSGYPSVPDININLPIVEDKADIMEAAAKKLSNIKLCPRVDFKELAARKECQYLNRGDCCKLVEVAKRISLEECQEVLGKGNKKRNRSEDLVNCGTPASKKQKGDDEIVIENTNRDGKDLDFNQVLTMKHFEEALKQMKSSVSIQLQEIGGPVRNILEILMKNLA